MAIVLKIVVKVIFCCEQNPYTSGLRVVNAVIKVSKTERRDEVKAMFACKQLKGQEAYMEIVTLGAC